MLADPTDESMPATSLFKAPASALDDGATQVVLEEEEHSVSRLGIGGVEQGEQAVFTTPCGEASSSTKKTWRRRWSAAMGWTSAQP